jgi:WhiB family transcriptional regulator, redox-sensing transcriptional regulator
MTTLPLAAAITTALPCATDSDLWFAEHPGPLAVAQARCGPCPLRAACLEGALERREPWGVWGGRILVDGVPVATKRGRGRPRRTDPVAA